MILPHQILILHLRRKARNANIPLEEVLPHPCLPCLHNDVWQMLLVVGAGALVFGVMAYVMVKEYVKYLGVDDDIEEYNGDRTRIRHEAGI